MLNGSGINPSNFTSQFPDGLTLPQANLIIPFPDDSNKYYLIHSTLDDINNGHASFLYYSTIDILLNGGIGEVINKNQIIISDNLNVGKISAVKHGNGRDWWVICHKINSNTFYKFLITSGGTIGNLITQSIGVNRPKDIGQTYFSPDGSRYAYYWLDGGLDILNFDRCTGLFSNPIHINVDNNEGNGISFSPSGNVLYASATDTLVQFDLTATNIAATKQVVGIWDTTMYSGTIPQLPAYIELMALAPDGRIYITTGNSTFHYHVIEQPDSLGTACNFIPLGLNLNHYYFNTLPNHPNYHLGPLVGSICDSITGIAPPEKHLTLKLYPNPNSGSFQITYTPLPENLHLQVFNILGEEVHNQLLPQWSQLQNIHIGNLPAGVYMATITSSASKKSIKFVVE